MLNNSRNLSWVAHGFIIASSLLFFFYAISSPTQNWDILGYAASAISIENADENYVHDYVYQGFKAYATDEEFESLTVGKKDDEILFADANAFNQEIPFYKIRIIFVLLILGLVKLGVNIFLASHIVSAALTCAGLLVFYYAYRRVIHPAFWMIVPFFFQISGILDVSQTVTADSLAFFWTGLICFAFMQAHWRLLFLFLVLSVMMRTDMIVLVALFTGYFILFQPDLRKLAIVSMLASLGVYFVVNSVVGNYGWSTVFYLAFVSNMTATHPVEYSSFGVTIEQYISAVTGNLKLIFYDVPFLLFGITITLQAIIFWLSQNKGGSVWDTLLHIHKTPVLVLSLLSVIYLLLHYLLFPAIWARFFVGQYMIGLLGLLFVVTVLIEKVSISK